MKRTIIAAVFLLTALSGFAQRLATVGIPPFEVSGSGVTESDAGEATRRVTGELSAWGTMTILPGDQAESGEYLIRGQISRQNNLLVLSAATIEKRTGKTLNITREQAPALDGISMESFCVKVAENIPFPNYLLGKWRSTINMVDGPVTCVLEFLSDRSIRVEQFDTWEHNGTNSLKYQAIGKGSYTYAGYRRRTVTLGGRQIQSDATVGINLTLEDALPKYAAVSSGGLRVLFDETKSSFDLVYGGIPCGDNFTGASVYPGAHVYYTRFAKM